MSLGRLQWDRRRLTSLSPRIFGTATVPAVDAARSENPDAMFDGMFPSYHLIFKAEPSKHLGSFAGHRFADVKARERFLFEDDRLDTFPDEEHGRRRAARSASDNKYVSFHQLYARIKRASRSHHFS